jgi:hypothetical protein
LPGTQKRRLSTVNLRRRWGLLLGGAVGVAAASLVAVVLVDRMGGKVEAPAVAPAGAPALPRNPGQIAAGHLDDAEELLRQREMKGALEKLEAARALPIDEPRLRKRLTRVERRIESVLTFQQAQRSLDGGDPALAVKLAKQSLDLDPQNAEALDLHIAAARALATGEGRDDDENDNSSDRPARGWLSITTTPPAPVFIDGEPVGRSPIRRLALPPGKHAIEVRLQGYKPYTRQLRLGAGREEDVSAALTVERHPSDDRPSSP